MRSDRDTTDRITGYYSYLFTFPSRRSMIAIIAGISAAGCSLAFVFSFGPDSAFHGLLYGILGLMGPLLISDALTSVLFKDNALLTPRRFTVLSYSSAIVYVVLILFSSVAGALTGFPRLLVRGVLFAISMNASLRHLVITVFSTRALSKNLYVTFLQPVLCLIASAIVLPISDLRILILGGVGVAIMLGGAQLIFLVMNWWGERNVALNLISLFRAFIFAWAADFNGPLEDQISKVGEVRDLSVDGLVFVDVESNCRAALVVPYIHPGPFRNVGSSVLPKNLTEHLGKRLGCNVLVPHGISTHKRNLTRIDDVKRVVEAVASGLSHDDGIGLVSPLIFVEVEGAQASCQLFGDVALITLTLSPKSCEDLPEDLGYSIMDAASGMGVTAVVIDSHNSIKKVDEMIDSDLKNLYNAAVKAIKLAKEAPQYAFNVGAARVVPPLWSLDDGMGPCGVATLVIKLEEGQTNVYVVLDGNNMRSGLRERILAALKAHGFDEGEVLTSDTHLVNAIGATSRGYYPLGERIDEEKLIEYVVETAQDAFLKLKKGFCSHNRMVVRELTILGEAGLDLLSSVLTSAFNLFKRTALLVVSASTILTFVLIFFL